MMRAGARPASRLAVPPRRLIIYSVFDKDGHVDEFIVHALAALRPHAAYILAVVNGDLTPSSRSALEAAVDEVLMRENRGFDIGAHRAALQHLGRAIAEFDEIVLTNDTWYGPVRPWGPVFERMDQATCDFWALTDHAPTHENPFTRGGVAPYHLQSFWTAVRRPMFTSASWQDYWADLPPLDSYVEAVTEHELRFTEYFTSAGWVAEAAFPLALFDSENPSLFEAESLVEHGCPVLKRRPMFHWPPLLDAHASVGAWTLDSATSGGYPVELILRNLARTVPPKAMNVDAGLLTVLPTGEEGTDRPLSVEPARVLVVLHTDAVSGEAAGSALRRIEEVVGECDLVVTTTEDTDPGELMSQLAAVRPVGPRIVVRPVPNGAGTAAALLIACREELLALKHRFVVRLAGFDGAHRVRGEHLGGHEYENLVADPGYFAALVALFDDEPSLGIVYPPMPHIGTGNLGRGWGASKPLFATVARSLGITVPLDDVSPLAPFDGMFVARPEALRLLAERSWTYGDFEGTEGLHAALERMWSYAAGQLGFHTRTVASRGYLSLSHAVLEYELDEMSATIPGRSFEKIDFLRHSGWAGSGRAGDLLRMYVRRRHPWLVHVARRAADPERLPGRLLPRRSGERGRES